MDDAYLNSPVEMIMDKNVIILDESASINEAARVMETNGVTSVLVRNSKTGSVTGIVTERDILYRAVAKSLGTFKVNIGSIMSTPVVTVEKGTRCIEAIRIMREKDLRRLPVIIDGKIAGITSLISIVGNMRERNIDLIELELPRISENTKVTCPYCESRFTDKADLSKHIDRIHLGSGLLEGDTRKWE